MNINWLLAVQGKASMSEPSYRNGADIFVRERIGFGYLRHTAWKARFESHVLGDPLRALRRVQEALHLRVTDSRPHRDQAKGVHSQTPLSLIPVSP